MLTPHDDQDGLGFISRQIRHLDGIKANFSVSETEYLASATLVEEAIPAENRIKEIEEGFVLGSTEVIQIQERKNYSLIQ